MTLFAILSKPDEGPEALNVVPERFVWSAFLFTPFWALARRAWGLLFLWALVVAALAAGQSIIGTDAAWALYWVLALWCGFAAPAIATHALANSGWLHHGELAAPDIVSAERLWLEKIYGARR